MARPAQRRQIVWISAVAAFAVVIAAVFVLSHWEGGSSSISSSKSTVSKTSTTATCAGSSTSQTITIVSGPLLVGATGKAAAGVTCADGHMGTILYYNHGQPISIGVTVPDSLTPIAIQTVFDGNPQGRSPWDVSSTGRTYVLDYGAAGASPLTIDGTHDVYATVTFSDNSTATSNLVIFTVNPPASR